MSNRRQKRQRRHLSWDHHDSFDDDSKVPSDSAAEEDVSEDDDLLRQAIQNSLTDTRIADRHEMTIEAPHFYPSPSEFQDPVEFISTIRSQVENVSGICVIHPPSGWKPDCQVIGNPALEKRVFQTKYQKLNGLSEGAEMSDGSNYTIASYKSMADKFTQDWVEHNHPSEDPASLKFEITAPSVLPHTPPSAELLAKLESDYWRLLQNSRREDIGVEYASDLGSEIMTSGFPLREGLDPPIGQANDEGEVFGSKEYYRQCGWNLNNLPRWPGSMLRWIGHDVDGVTKPCKSLSSLLFQFHI